MDPSTVEEKTNNAKYAISVARKLGACVFVAAEDIVEVCWSYSRLRFTPQSIKTSVCSIPVSIVLQYVVL